MKSITDKPQQHFIDTVKSEVEEHLLNLPANVQVQSMKKPETEYDYYMLHGQLTCAQDRPAKALRSFRECLRINPRSFTACTAIARISRGRGDYKQAIQYFEKALEIAPKDFNTKLQLLALKMKLKAPASTVQALENELLSASRQLCATTGVAYEKFAPAASLMNKHPGWGSAFTTEATECFRKKKFTVLRRLFPEPLTDFLYAQYIYYLKSGQMLFQDHMQRYVKPEDPISYLVQQQLCEQVQKVVGIPIVPTYTIGIHYIKGGHIKPHIDRFQNEISMTICIGAEPAEVSWPLYAVDEGKEIYDILQPNDAFLYRGNEITHYRRPLPEGLTVTQLIVGFRTINKKHCNCQ
jgi:hypothetical protein